MIKLYTAFGLGCLSIEMRGCKQRRDCNMGTECPFTPQRTECPFTPPRGCTKDPSFAPYERRLSSDLESGKPGSSSSIFEKMPVPVNDNVGNYAKRRALHRCDHCLMAVTLEHYIKPQSWVREPVGTFKMALLCSECLRKAKLASVIESLNYQVEVLTADSIRIGEMFEDVNQRLDKKRQERDNMKAKLLAMLWEQGPAADESIEKD